MFWFLPPPKPEPLGPAASSDLVLAAPIDKWDEAIPIGNGLMGGLVYGSGETIKLALNRSDVWDLRKLPELQRPDWTYGTLQRLVIAKDQDQIVDRFDKPYDNAYPTKLPGFRIEITLSGKQPLTQFSLPLKTGVAGVKWGGSNGGFCISRFEPAAVGHIDGKIRSIKIVPPSFGKLNYKEPTTGKDHDGQWMDQETYGGHHVAIFLSTKETAGGTDISVAFTTDDYNADALAEGRRIAKGELFRGFRRAAEGVKDGWDKYWKTSQVRVPDAAIQSQYDLANYYLGANSRRAAPAISLEGVWIADNGNLPPWKSDYHHDLNTELTYWPYLASGHFEQGNALLDFLWTQLPEYQKFARDFYDSTGAAIPGVADLAGRPLTGWPMYSLSLSMGPWISEAFIDHWRYTQNHEFLTHRAYPFCKQIAQCVALHLHPNKDGSLLLPLSSSPEIHDEDLAAWQTPNSNFDQAVLQSFFRGMIEMAEVLNEKKDLVEWKRIDKGLGHPLVDKDSGVLKVSPTENLTESHRHFSHLMSIHPFSILNIEGSDEDRAAIDKSLAQIKQLGTDAWAGYSFSWASAMFARVGRGDEALDYLEKYCKGFVTRNGFHINGDLSGTGLSKYTSRAFTLEGNFAAEQAVHEMLLQSWGGKVRIFPAMPKKWQDASFNDLRAIGGLEVSGTWQNGHVDTVSIKAARSGTYIITTPERMHWSGQATDKGQSPAKAMVVELSLRAGQTVSAHLQRY